MKERIEFTSEQVKILQAWIEKFKNEFPKTRKYQELVSDHREHVNYFQNVLPQKLEELTEEDVVEIVNSLWALKMWGSKLRKARSLIDDNGGLEKLSLYLKLLYSRDKTPEEIYDEIISSIKGVSSATATEMLAYIYPDKCGIWNKRSREGLRKLKLDSYVNIKKNQISKEEYVRFNELVSKIIEVFKSSRFKDVTFLTVDMFLFYVSEFSVEDNEKIESEIYGHDEICNFIKQIGEGLGFDIDSERSIGPGARVDVIWEARVANLGVLRYAFEVQIGGNIDSLILNLQRASRIPGVQRVIAVSDKQQIEKIQRECKDLEENFQKILRFWEIEDVIHTWRHLEQVLISLDKLGLLENKNKFES